MPTWKGTTRRGGETGFVAEAAPGALHWTAAFLGQRQVPNACPRPSCAQNSRVGLQSLAGVLGDFLPLVGYMGDLGSTTHKGDDRRRFLDRFGYWVIGKVGSEADSMLSQVSYVIRLQFWPIFFTVLWIVICCVPDQVVEYYSALVQSARASNSMARSGLVALAASGFVVPSTISASALALAVLPGSIHLGATRKTAARLTLQLPFALLVASLLAIPLGMLQPRAWRTLEPDDYPILGLVLLGYIAASILIGTFAFFAYRGRLASGAFAIAGSRSRRGVAATALAALIAAPLAVGTILTPVFGQLTGMVVADIADEQPILPYPEFGLFVSLGAFIAALTVTFTSLSYLFRNLIGFPLIPVLFAVAAISSAFDLNDNHKIRETKLTVPVPRLEYPLAFSAWLCSRWDLENFIERPQQCPQPNAEGGPERSKRPPAAGGAYPVYIVAAQGGGIYAAYEAALFLARIGRRVPRIRTAHLLHQQCVGRQSRRCSVFGRDCPQSADAPCGVHGDASGGQRLRPNGTLPAQ
jgi:hypothetical protein